MRTILICGLLILSGASVSADDLIPVKFQQRFAEALASLRVRLREPSSLSLANATVMKSTGSICFIYRARNGFGGMGVDYFALLQPENQILTRDYTGFREVWDKRCVNGKTEDITSAAQRVVLGLK